jgi:hypothetical protein
MTVNGMGVFISLITNGDSYIYAIFLIMSNKTII